MAYAYRGKRTAYDNIAVGSVAGNERTIGQSSSDLADLSDPSLYNPDVSGYGGVRETGGFSNIANAELPGIEDTNKFNTSGTVSPEKLTSDGETVGD